MYNFMSKINKIPNKKVETGGKQKFKKNIQILFDVENLIWMDGKA